MTLVNHSPVARSVPHDTITGLASQETQTALETLFGIFRDILKEPTGFVNKYSDSVMTFTNATRTFAIAPLSGSFQFCIRAQIFTVSSVQSFQIPVSGNEGLWYFYWDSNGLLQGSLTPWVLTDPIAPISTGYWDSTNSRWIRENEERHGVIMDADTHRLLHKAEGPKVDFDTSKLAIINYTTTGDGSLDSHAQFGITDGTYFDEDISIEIKHANVPANNFEQFLRPYAKLPVFYLNGIDDWRRKDSSNFAVYNNAGSTCSYNILSGGTWTTQPCTDTYFFATWLIYTDDIKEPVISLLGQRQDPDLISAINNNTRVSLVVPAKFSEEFYLYRKLIWQTSTSYANTPKARLAYVATASEVNPASDRYATICSYNGNATNGKFLEFYPGQSSDVSPFPIPDPSYLRTITLTSVANSTGTVSIYKSTNLVTPIFQISLSNSMYTKNTLTLLLAADDKLVAKISSGTINKPCITIWIQTSL